MILLWHRTSHQDDICLKDHHQAALQTLLISPSGLTFGRRCWTRWIVPSVVGAGNSCGIESRETRVWSLLMLRKEEIHQGWLLMVFGIQIWNLKENVVGSIWKHYWSPCHRTELLQDIGRFDDAWLQQTGHFVWIKLPIKANQSGWQTLDWCANLLVTFVVVTWLWFYVGFYEGFLCDTWSEFGEFLMRSLHLFCEFPTVVNRLSRPIPLAQSHSTWQSRLAHSLSSTLLSMQDKWEWTKVWSNDVFKSTRWSGKFWSAVSCIAVLCTIFIIQLFWARFANSWALWNAI